MPLFGIYILTLKVIILVGDSLLCSLDDWVTRNQVNSFHLLLANLGLVTLLCIESIGVKIP